MGANERMLEAINYAMGWLEGLAMMAELAKSDALANGARLLIGDLVCAVERASKEERIARERDARERDEPPTMDDYLRGAMPEAHATVEALGEEQRVEFYDRLGRSFAAAVERGLLRAQARERDARANEAPQ